MANTPMATAMTTTTGTIRVMGVPPGRGWRRRGKPPPTAPEKTTRGPWIFRSPRRRACLHVLQRHRVLAHLEELRVRVDHRVGVVPHPQLSLVHPDRVVAQLLDGPERVGDEHDRAVLAAQ